MLHTIACIFLPVITITMSHFNKDPPLGIPTYLPWMMHYVHPDKYNQRLTMACVTDKMAY